MKSPLRTTSVLHSLNAPWQWLMVKPGQPAPTPPRPANCLHLFGSRSHADRAAITGNPSLQFFATGPGATPSRPVRVLHVVEAGQSPTHSGRLRISGRMVDVCAELDRLAAREALQN